MFLLQTQISRGETLGVVHVPPFFGGPAGCDAVIVRRAGGIYGWWRDSSGKSPGRVSQELLRDAASVALPGERIILGT